MFSLDGSGPIYEQLSRGVRTAIFNGVLGPGDRLPPSRTLASDLGVSRTSVLAAYDSLIAEGFLESRQGSGTYVARVSQQAAANGVALDEHAAVFKAPARSARMAAEHLRFARYAEPKADDVDLRYGMPLVDHRLLRSWRSQAIGAVTAEHVALSHPQGLPELRRSIADYLRSRRGLDVDAGSILVVSGSQQAISLIATTLLEPKSCVVLEEPHYWGARLAFQRAGHDVVATPVGPDGLMVRRLPTDRQVSAIYVTPSHQYPTGANMPVSVRRDLVDWAGERGVLIIEDDYDSEYRFLSKAQRPIYSLRRPSGSVYVGTFSKLLFPALRIGFIIADPALLEALTAAKWVQDLGSDRVTQAALARFIDGGYFERQIQRNVKALKRRGEALKGALEKRLGSEISVREGHCGMQFLLQAPNLPPEAGEPIARAAAERGVLVDPANDCYLGEPPCAEFIMGFTRCAEDRLETGAARFASAIKERWS